MPRSGSARRRACSSSLARPARAALAPTVEALPLMVCRSRRCPRHRPRRAGVRAGRRGPPSGTKRRNTGRSAPGCRRNARRYRPAPRPVRPRPLPLPARPGAAPAEMTEQAKHQALLGRSASPHGRSCPPPGLRGRPARRWRSWPDRQPGERPSARILRVASRPSISGICMSISTASNGTHRLQHLLNARQPAVGEGHPGASLLNSSAATWRFSALSSTTSRRTPRNRWVRSTGRGGGLAGAPLFAVQRMQHRVGQLLGRDRLGEKIDEGRRAVVAHRPAPRGHRR